jgi:hypothetical protein
VVAFLQIYQRGGKAPGAVNLSVSVIDQKGAAVDRVDAVVSADRFSKEGTADYRFNLPLAILAPGPHLLTIEAKAGDKTIRRDVRFVRR